MKKSPTNYGRLIVSLEAITDDDEFWRQKLVRLGYPYDTPNPQEFYFIATGFVSERDVIEAGLKLGGDSLRLLMDVKKISPEVFVGGGEAGDVDIDNAKLFPLIPEWVIDYVNANIKDKDEEDIASVYLWLYTWLYRMTPDERKVFVKKYVTRPWLNPILVHFGMAVAPGNVRSIIGKLIDNPYIADLPSMYPPDKDLRGKVTSTEDYYKLVKAYKKNDSKYNRALLLVDYNREASHIAVRHLSYYIYKHFDEALDHPWLLNKDLLPEYRTAVLNIFRGAAIYHNKEDLLAQRLEE